MQEKSWKQDQTTFMHHTTCSCKWQPCFHPGLSTCTQRISCDLLMLMVNYCLVLPEHNPHNMMRDILSMMAYQFKNCLICESNIDLVLQGSTTTNVITTKWKENKLCEEQRHLDYKKGLVIWATFPSINYFHLKCAYADVLWFAALLSSKVDIFHMVYVICIDIDTEPIYRNLNKTNNPSTTSTTCAALAPKDFLPTHISQ